MKVLLTQIKWQFILLQRNSLILVSALVTLMYMGIFFLISDFAKSEWVLTLLIYNDPAIIGMFFIGLQIFTEKKHNILSALSVSPLSLHSYLLARIIPLSIIGWACSMGMAISVFGWEFHMLHFSMGVLFTCFMFCLLGIYLIVQTDEFLLFLLKSIPVLIIMSIPLADYYELIDFQFITFFPIQGPLKLMIGSYESQQIDPSLIPSYFISIVWSLALYLLIYRYVERKWKKGI